MFARNVPPFGAAQMTLQARSIHVVLQNVLSSIFMCMMGVERPLWTWC